LHRAVEAGNQEGVRLIVELGVEIDGMVPGTGCDRTVLHNAAGWNRLEMVKLLIELGADPRLRDLTHHGTALGWALYNGNKRAVVDYLLQFATIFEAVQSGAVERVATLLRENPALAGARDDQGRPLAFHVNPDGSTLRDMIRLLVEHGTDLNARDKEGRTLVDRALANGRIDLAELLRAYGAS
jgi:ankyrin repeat protein